MRMRKKRNIWDHLSPDQLPCSIKKCFLLIKFPGCPRENVLLIFSYNSQISMCLIKVFGKSKGRFATILFLHSWLQKQEGTWICHTGYESLGSQVSWVIKSQLGENLVWRPVLDFIAPDPTLCLWALGWLCDSPTFSRGLAEQRRQSN